jgi:tripartite-type tricarboxylate transporter receptor subunit TctC
VHEAGVPGYEVTSWNGIGVPAKTPRPVIDRLNRAMTEALAAPDVKQRFQELAVETFPSTPDAFRKHIAAEIAKWRQVIQTAGIPRQ